MFKKKEIINLLELLNKELAKEDIKGELYLVGGAVMCLAFSSRPSTRDIDALFLPSDKIRSAAKRVAIDNNIEEDWLNDAVKGFLSKEGDFEPFMKRDHLTVFCASAQYLLAMKCLAMRIGEEFQDINDVRYLLRDLNLTEFEKTKKILEKYYPLEKYPAKTLFVLEDLLSELAH